jgi:hypothetical protein
MLTHDELMEMVSRCVHQKSQEPFPYRMAVAIADLIASQAARIAELEAHVAALQEKFDAETSCGCSYDDTDDVCMGHSPKLAAANARAEKAEALIEHAKSAISMYPDAYHRLCAALKEQGQ